MGQEHIRDLLISNVNRIENPNNSSIIYRFTEIDELVDVLFAFLKFPVEEKRLEGLEEKILDALNVFSDQQLDIRKLPGALEDLSTGFEGFLKKIAVLKYKTEPVKLIGDGVNYLGLLNTPLGGMLDGKVSKVDPRNNSIPVLLAPTVTFTYSEITIQETIYNYVRKSRNEIHVAQKKSVMELFNSFRFIISSYLFALEENIILIRNQVDPIFIYLEKLQEEFEKMGAKYVSLLGEERTLTGQMDFSHLHILEWRDDVDFSKLAKPSFEDLINDPMTDTDISRKSSRMSVQEISAENRAFWLVGEPGAGKSTTLQALALKRARDLMSIGYLTKPFPVYIPANRFDKMTPLIQLICISLKIEPSNLEKYLEAGKCWLLIDGVNEISFDIQEAVLRETQLLYSTYEDIHILLTSRKYNFKAKLNIPVYELLPLSDDLILEFLKKNMVSENVGSQFFGLLTGTENILLDFARNPLLLRMLALVGNEGNMPENRGQLFRQFTRWIFSREEKLRKFGTNQFFIELALSHVAFNIRSGGKINAPYIVVIDWIAEVISELHANIDATQILHELLDSHILEVDANDLVMFFHELIQEYFCSLELKRIYLKSPNSIIESFVSPTWYEPIAMLSGLLDNADALVLAILPNNVRLSAKCVWSGAIVDSNIITDIILYSEQIVLKSLSHKSPKKESKLDAYVSLLELGTPDSLRTIIKLLAIDSKFSLTNALISCERPEVATIKLLRFGLTGQKRVYQCLSALKDKTISKSILNSPEVTTAELTLLEGEVEARNLTLIAEIGLPVSLKPKMRNIILEIISTFDITDARWRSSIVIAANDGLMDEILDLITQRFLSSKLSGELYYSMFIVCTSLKNQQKQLELTIDITRNCLKLGLYGLAIKYITNFNLSQYIPFAEIKEHVVQITTSGRLESLIEFEKAYSSDDFTPYIQTAFSKLLGKSTINDLMYMVSLAEDHLDKLEPIASQNYDLIKSNLIYLGKNGYRPKVIRKFIKAFNLQKIFSKVGVVRRFIDKKGYGFINDLNSDRCIFFHISKVNNQKIAKGIKPRMLVEYAYQELPQDSEKFRATSVTIL